MVFKHILDKIFGVILLILLSPILAIIAIAIKLDSKGPVIFKQKRLGKDGEIFEIYKFRTMYVDAPDIRNEDGSTFNSDNDPRVTKVGNILRKTSLDELAQLFNILKGEMSFIGPRPDLPEQLERYSDDEKRKLNVKPGITGYSQAYYRNSIKAEDKFKNDVFYVDNYSLILDIKIFLATVKSVIFRSNINNNN
ncbi:sugar transferase [Terrisporobacter mayombei]|uniref:sugar transferase n=1 Tax=Terrisporobacter mayombei TaxID=1541 RepID=UPI00265A7886|nr:sugar transferase [Terrisporobacter mayombei]MCC3670630.1 sugar transferase [Terrisporobacter mayombei]